MRQIFLDVNVLLDVTLRRFPHAEYSSQILSSTNFSRHTSSLAVAIFHYQVMKEFNRIAAKNHLEKLLQHCHVLDVNELIIRQSFDSLFEKFTDFEDAIQHSCAFTHSMDAIITRNEKDFRNSELPVYSPKKFLQLFAE